MASLGFDLPALIEAKKLAVDGVYRRTLGVLKSRGTPHSNMVRTFALTDRGLQMLDTTDELRHIVAVGPGFLDEWGGNVAVI